MEKGLEVPEIILQSISYDSYLSFNFAKYLINKGLEVPEIILQSISKNSEFSYFFAKDLIEKGLKVPEIIKQSAKKYKDNLFKENYFIRLYEEL
jgi:hypothetical protein